MCAQEEECSRLNTLLMQAQQAGDSARAREEDARASGREMADRARRAEAMVAEHQADVAQVRTCMNDTAPPPTHGTAPPETPYCRSRNHTPCNSGFTCQERKELMASSEPGCQNWHAKTAGGMSPLRLGLAMLCSWWRMRM